MKFINAQEELDYIERAAILEWDGGLSREEAEAQAKVEIEARRSRTMEDPYE